MGDRIRGRAGHRVTSDVLKLLREQSPRDKRTLLFLVYMYSILYQE